MKKILTLIICSALICLPLKFSFADKKSEKLTKHEENSIKNIVEEFISSDFRYNGGDNNFNTIESKEFKEYLKARNDLKDYNNEKQNYKPFNDKFTFNYDSISKKDNKAIVEVFVKDQFSYYLNNEKTDNAISSDSYIVYLTKIDGLWKVSSATIKTDVDLIDNKFDVNKELNSDNTTFYKSSSKNEKNENLDKMLASINQIKSDLDNNNDRIDNPQTFSDLGGDISNKKRDLIYKYAYTYREGRRNPNYLSFKNRDCANYASQALKYAGGRTGSSHVMDGKSRTWSLTPDSFHVMGTYGDAWAQAHYLRGFIVRNEGGSKGPGGHAIAYGSTLKKGDLTFIYNGKWFHTYIVVKPGPNFSIASHTADKWMVPINIAAPERDYKRSYIHLTSLN